MPYGDFIIDLGYKMYTTVAMPGDQELYPTKYVIRRGYNDLKAYKGRIGGHTVLMLNGFLTTFINWGLLILVLTYFTPAIFPSIDPTLAKHSQTAYDFFYSIVCLHLIVTSALSVSMLWRSIYKPYTTEELESGLVSQTLEV